MRKYNIISFVFLCGFLLLFRLMISGVSFGAFGKVTMFAMIVFPVIGVGTGLKGSGWSKWVLVALNGVVFGIIAYALILGH